MKVNKNKYMSPEKDSTATTEQSEPPVKSIELTPEQYAVLSEADPESSEVTDFLAAYSVNVGEDVKVTVKDEDGSSIERVVTTDPSDFFTTDRKATEQLASVERGPSQGTVEEELGETALEAAGVDQVETESLEGEPTREKPRMFGELDGAIRKVSFLGKDGKFEEGTVHGVFQDGTKNFVLVSPDSASQGAPLIELDVDTVEFRTVASESQDSEAVGVLQSDNEIDPIKAELDNIFNNLSPEDRAAVWQYTIGKRDGYYSEMDRAESRMSGDVKKQGLHTRYADLYGQSKQP